jgi:hypothetical protein
MKPTHTIHIPAPLVWEPQPDITTYELALCMPLFHSVGRHHQLYAQLPPGAQRHWRNSSPGV